MSNPPNKLLDQTDQFDALFRKAEKSEQFWVSKAKYNFTEEMLTQMESLGINKAQLASLLEVKPAQISRLCSGANNFTIDTMVRIALALKCEFRCHLQAAGVTTHWIDVLKDEPIRVSGWSKPEETFEEISTDQKSFYVVPAA